MALRKSRKEQNVHFRHIRHSSAVQLHPLYFTLHYESTRRNGMYPKIVLFTPAWRSEYGTPKSCMATSLPRPLYDIILYHATLREAMN
ncbi:hypothetical protein RvY_11566 [Ramazzottius varieornatus]|uniref:Uncharacterized protein n=1 Tax=Ramazzottius varieornatus TaxID=947166 RepID=A0A1D1VGJ0_RAMVA|nr:hypothetical protein RvY_11566 [Ramazzottius varieornatus]